MGILNRDDLRAIEDAQRDTLGNAVETPRVYRLGRKLPDGTPELPVEGRPGWFWVRPQGEDSGEAIPANNTGLVQEQIIYGAYVKCAPFGSELEIIREAPQNKDYAGSVPAPAQRAVRLDQFNYGLLVPSSPPSMRVSIYEARYVVGDTVYHVPNLLSKDFTADIPATANTAIGVLIELDATTRTLYYTNSSGTFGAGASLLSVFNTLPTTLTDNRFLVGWVKLYQGMSAIARSEILPAQEILSKGTGGSSTTTPNRLFLPFAGDYLVLSSGEYLEFPEA